MNAVSKNGEILGVGDVGIHWRSEYIGMVARYGYVSTVNTDGTISVSDGHSAQLYVNPATFDLVCKADNRADKSDAK